MRPRSIPNEAVPGAGLPPFERFEKFVGMILQVSKKEADREKGSELRANTTSSPPENVETAG